MSMLVLAIDSSSLSALWSRTVARLANAGDLAIELLLAALILTMGWLLARWARGGTQWLLRRLHFNEAMRPLGGPPLGAPSFEPASLASWAVYWSIWLFAF